jgi:NAD(P)-dependent dehydrogenase (short-subunit alcohol dehydrogenase family)
MGRLNGKVAIVTGAASGIGKAIAQAFRTEGAVVHRLDIAPGADAVLDVRDEAGWSDAINAVVKAHGKLDILVNAAGVAHQGMLLDMQLAEFRRVNDINLESAFLGCKAAAAAMRATASPAHGVILNVSSVSGDIAVAGSGAYGVSKSALTNLSRALAVEFGRKGDFIRVVALCPGPVRTPMLESMMPADAFEPGSPAWNDVPLRSYATPEEIAESAVYASSEDGKFLTAATLIQDGGWSKGVGW